MQKSVNMCQFYFLISEGNGMIMGLFFNRKRSIDLFAPVAGVLEPIEKVSDEVFASKAMGDGFAIKPKSGEIYSPIDGTVTSVFPTKHAIGLKTKGNLEILVHLGIDTVELNGKGFEVFVKEGDVVSSKTKLVDVDLNFLASEKKPNDIMVIFTNLDKHALTYEAGNVNQGDKVGTVE